ncbi:S-ribosylhomocysteine lyase @ Autoinducer-2 production protein LuxS [Olavius algarvensis spirochete endosymbiont]|uniref:S-ribosylhomocysteine lyase n=1 Tax=Olavius algarvensis spirochete endosymbiont TaxID=260710 RepID=UPI00052C36F7|nr:S-ribosylhomocysteine lyase [Olavius algarvensis spirochete endosymbiont]KGM43445.1 S-ribosylhomocysteinase [Alkalispirochaeta odontotermitis]VDA99545.1 S-ribosylhomocysteine lyase @ Autoinducer-2 production protein LuxS [Olavius algarvensis spirochete endosymbiont]
MERIASFTVDHDNLLRGIYVSRRDSLGDKWLTTFDIRMKEPNREPVLDVPLLHTIEHLGATWLRNNSNWGGEVVYFGPMGCRTGCYLILKGDLESREIVQLIKEMFTFIANYSYPIPGASPSECGNHLSHDLPMAALEAKKFLIEILTNPTPENLEYPG